MDRAVWLLSEQSMCNIPIIDLGYFRSAQCSPGFPQSSGKIGSRRCSMRAKKTSLFNAAEIKLKDVCAGTDEPVGALWRI